MVQSNYAHSLSVLLTFIIYPFISLQFKYKMSNNHRFRLSNIVSIYFLALYLAGQTEQKCEFNNFLKNDEFRQLF